MGDDMTMEPCAGQPAALPVDGAWYGSADACTSAALWRAAGRLLREVREARGWSQEDLACRAGIPLGIVAQCELGEKRSHRLEECRAVAMALGFDRAAFIRAVRLRADRPS